LVIGRHGPHQGQFNKPRAAAVSPAGFLYVADMTGRIQKFNMLGEYLLDWSTPDIEKGRPRALAVAPDGTVLVCDCHYYAIRRYTPDGTLISSFGTKGFNTGEFSLMTDISIDEKGNIYTTQYEDRADCVQIFSPDGVFKRRFGSYGKESGQFDRPMGIAVDRNGFIYVADCCNHRVQKFTASGELVKIWGGFGNEPGKLMYPYDIICDSKGRLLVVEYGNNRVSKFSDEGKLLAVWGAHGTGRQNLIGPWGAAATGVEDEYFIVDSSNHRVLKVSIPDGGRD
jgi:DNA-binding beta-propeller fold protein YncE